MDPLERGLTHYAPTIPIRIGEHIIKNCLLDLGASVNLIPFSVYQQLGLGELQPTNLTLCLADRSTKYPKGIVEDIIIQVDEFYYPADFVVLETQPISDTSNHTPIILGRPFLATANANINCRNGSMTLSFGNLTLNVNNFNHNSSAFHLDDEEEVNLIDTYVASTFPQNQAMDPLERCLTHYDPTILDDPSCQAICQYLDSVPLMYLNPCQTPFFEPLRVPPKDISLEPVDPKLTLKPLPDTLKYAFLSET